MKFVVPLQPVAKKHGYFAVPGHPGLAVTINPGDKSKAILAVESF
jgi:hypothetical protein